MKKAWGLPILAAAMWAATGGTAAALPFSPDNVRPVAVNAAPVGETSLQSMLNTIFAPLAPIYGVPDATADQSKAGVWSLATAPGGMVPALAFEQTAASSSNIYGLWSWSDTLGIVQVPIFLGAATPASPLSATAFLTWLDPTTVVIGGFGCGVWVNCSTSTPTTYFADSKAFGFYLQSGSNVFYSLDALNTGGAAHSLSFQQGPTTNWAIAFEDGTDGDFNDGVMKVESIQPVPEPATLTLLGTGLAGLFGAARRRNRAAQSV